MVNIMLTEHRSFVHVTLSYAASEAILTVKDIGVGIPGTISFAIRNALILYVVSDINLIGERFHRVQSVSRSHEGTGIGLALIKVRARQNGD